MIQFETAKGKYLAVTLPAGAYNISINKRVTIEGMQMLEFNTPDMLPSTLTALPPGTYTIVGIADRLGEGKCKSIIQDDYGAFPDFVHKGFIYTTAKDSFASLLRSHNIPSSALIIKIEE